MRRKRKSVLRTGPPPSHSEPLKTLQECPTPESILVIMLLNAHPTISNVPWKEGALLIWGQVEKCPGWTALTQGQVHMVGGGILGVGMGTTLDGHRSVIPTESADQPRTGHGTGHVTDMTTVTDTTIHSATGLPITLLTIPELTTGHRSTVVPTINIRGRLTRGTRIIISDLTKRVETEEMSITEVVFGSTRPKVATIRIAIGAAIHRRRVTGILQALRSLARPKDTEKTDATLRLTGKKDDSF